eukprot:CAMPEP_0116913732 /NCGR_PEP_ID=MMETSP0467-20121206/16877_1 /TAXON_ID=283647 /ORGANISM="Mesodinium pulex, Strain SPMC105" /LENGTH=129 /DNA_ID=CAMNT_0004589999 /DNA_START=145 /DNA_END=534 /DNA_ORIENTATION=+
MQAVSLHFTYERAPEDQWLNIVEGEQTFGLKQTKAIESHDNKHTNKSSQESLSKDEAEVCKRCVCIVLNDNQNLPMGMLVMLVTFQWAVVDSARTGLWKGTDWAQYDLQDKWTLFTTVFIIARILHTWS